MKKIDKKRRIYFIVSLMSAILFVGGIPLIPVFAGKNWAIMAIGIVFVAFGFYGSPFLWLTYASFFKLKRVVEAIELEHLYSNKEIAVHLQLQEQDVKNVIIKAINKRYLEGYYYDGYELSLNKRVSNKRVEVEKCKSCGARMDVLDDKIYCPYCGTIASAVVKEK